MEEQTIVGWFVWKIFWLLFLKAVVLCTARVWHWSKYLYKTRTWFRDANPAPPGPVTASTTSGSVTAPSGTLAILLNATSGAMGNDNRRIGVDDEVKRYIEQLVWGIVNGIIIGIVAAALMQVWIFYEIIILNTQTVTGIIVFYSITFAFSYICLEKQDTNIDAIQTMVGGAQVPVPVVATPVAAPVAATVSTATQVAKPDPARVNMQVPAEVPIPAPVLTVAERERNDAIKSNAKQAIIVTAIINGFVYSYVKSLALDYL